jgi:PAS domain S-box-containing protein
VDYTGKTEAEQLGYGWLEQVHPEDRDHLMKCWQDVVHSGKNFEVQFRIRRADGVYRWFETRAVPVRDAAGKIVKWFGSNADIDDLKQTELALRRSERLYRAIGESIDYGVWVCAPDGRNVYASESFLNLVGITQQECSDFGWGAVLHPEDSARTISAWKECVRRGGVWDIEHRFRGVDGQWHAILARGVPVRDEHGQIECWAGINLDIDRLKKAQADVEEARAEAINDKNRLQAVMESLPVGVAIVDAHGGVVAVNHAYQQIWGGGPPATHDIDDYTAYRAWWLPSGQPVQPEEWASARAVQKGETVVGQRMQIERFDGARAYVHNSAAPVRDAKGQITGSAVTILDVTDQVEAEAERERLVDALARQRAMLSTILENTRTHLAYLDREFNFVQANSAYARGSGYPRERLLGRNHFDLFPNAENQAIFERVVRQGEGVEFKARPFEFPDQPERGVTYWDWTLVPVKDAEGRVQGLVFSLLDVTATKRSEEALRRAHDELELRVRERTRDLREMIARLEQEIRARRATEQALRESEERYRTLFDLAPGGILLADSAGRIHEANHALRASLGYTPEEIVHLSATRLYQKPDRHFRARQFLAWLRKAGRTDEIECCLRRKDGSLFPAALQVSRVDLHGRRALLTIFQDLTRRKQAEKRIEGVATLLGLFATKTSRQEYLDAVVRLLRDWCECQGAGIRLFDGQGHLPYVASVGFSRQYLKLENAVDLESDACVCVRALQGRSGPEGAPGEGSGGAFVCNQLSQLAAETDSGAPAWRRSPCVRFGYESVAHVPIRIHGRVTGSLYVADRRPGRVPAPTVEFIESVAHMVGEALHRFRVEEDLRESEARFRSLFESHHAVMLLLEPESGAIVDANPAAARFYGYGRERLRRMEVGDLNPRSRSGAEADRRLAGSGEGGLFVMPQRLARGDVRIVEVHSSPVTVGGRHLLFAIIHDITERKQLEKRVLEIGDEERQRMGRDLHDSLGGHLAGVALVAQALVRNLAGRSVGEATSLAEEIVRGLNEAVGQTRSIARGLCPVGIGAFGLVSGLQEYAASVARLFRVGCHFEARGDIAIPNEVVASHLYRITQEAVNNALRHGKARRVQIRLVRQEAGLQLRIRDDGRGLARPRKRATGMGLQTMKYRADVIGAQIETRSRRGKGTEVLCWLPGGTMRASR